MLVKLLAISGAEVCTVNPNQSQAIGLGAGIERNVQHDQQAFYKTGNA